MRSHQTLSVLFSLYLVQHTVKYNVCTLRRLRGFSSRVFNWIVEFQSLAKCRKAEQCLLFSSRRPQSDFTLTAGCLMVTPRGQMLISHPTDDFISQKKLSPLGGSATLLSSFIASVLTNASHEGQSTPHTGIHSVWCFFFTNFIWIKILLLVPEWVSV